MAINVNVTNGTVVSRTFSAGSGIQSDISGLGTSERHVANIGTEQNAQTITTNSHKTLSVANVDSQIGQLDVNNTAKNSITTVVNLGGGIESLRTSISGIGSNATVTNLGNINAATLEAKNCSNLSISNAFGALESLKYNVEQGSRLNIIS